MIHIASSPSSSSISTIVCPVLRNNGSLTGLASASHKRCSKQEKGRDAVWSVNRSSLDVVVVILSFFFSGCLPLQPPPARQRARAVTADRIANDPTNIHRSPPKTLALSALLLTVPSAASGQPASQAALQAQRLQKVGGHEELLGQLPTTRTHCWQGEGKLTQFSKHL